MMMKKIKSTIATVLCTATILTCGTVMAFAAKEGTHYYDSFSVATTGTTSSHLYGYRDIAFICRNLNSNNPSGQDFTVKLQTYDSGILNWVNFGARGCNSRISNGGYTYLNANTNSTLPKQGRFEINKVNNGYSVGGQLESYSSQV